MPYATHLDTSIEYVDSLIIMYLAVSYFGNVGGKSYKSFILSKNNQPNQENL